MASPLDTGGGSLTEWPRFLHHLTERSPWTGLVQPLFSHVKPLILLGMVHFTRSVLSHGRSSGVVDAFWYVAR